MHQRLIFHLITQFEILYFSSILTSLFNREIALEVLSHEPVGAFMVRESTSKPGCYALSLRVPRDFTVSGIAHYLILKTNKGYKIKVSSIDYCFHIQIIT